MVKRWLPPRYDGPGSHLVFFLKIQHVHGQKMINPLQYDRPGSHLGIFLKIPHVHGQKMIDPPSPPVWQARVSPRFFLKDSTCA